MRHDDLRSFLSRLSPTISVYCSVEGTSEADELANGAVVALGEPPAWWDSDLLVTAIDDAREADAASLAFFLTEAGDSYDVPLIDPVHSNVAVLAPLPMVVPLLEATQRAVDHVVVSLGPNAAAITVAHFPPDAAGERFDVQLASLDPAEIARATESVLDHDVELVLLALPVELEQAVADRLASASVGRRRVELLELDEDLSEEAVRAAATHAARGTVAFLRTFRFLASHGDTREGVRAVCDALSAGEAQQVLLTNSAATGLITWIGPEVTDIASDDRRGGVAVSAADAIARSAILQGAVLRIVPEHLGDLPQDGVSCSSAPGDFGG